MPATLAEGRGICVGQSTIGICNISNLQVYSRNQSQSAGLLEIQVSGKILGYGAQGSGALNFYPANVQWSAARSLSIDDPC